MITPRKTKIEVNLQRMMTMAKERRKTRNTSNAIIVKSMVTLQVSAEVRRYQDNITMMNPE
jgi:UDP-glucose 6-dehydrogenase